MKRVTVFGAGRSGVAAASFLANRGVEVTLTDSASEQQLPLANDLPPGVTRSFGGHTEQVIEGRDTIVLSPGIRRSLPILERAASAGVEIISEIELAFRHLKGRVIAVTGSNGKSTTTTLIGEILKGGGFDPIVAGNIGTPLTALLDEQPRNYVIELSSFQLETVESFRADIAVLLNITPDHMDRYDTMDDYAAAKYRIFRNQRPQDHAIVNGDDPRTAEPPTPAKTWRFSSRRQVVPGAWFDGESLVIDIEGLERRIPRKALALGGMANVENALASWLAARSIGATDLDAEVAFGSFRGLPHRMVMVRERNGVRWINDSKGTNVDATLKSLEGAEDRSVILILGGKDKKGEFERLRDVVGRKARMVLTIGDAASRVQSALEGTVQIVPCGDMQRAVQFAASEAREGHVVLLSPACASFDQYDNFERRGEHFEALVRELL